MNSLKFISESNINVGPLRELPNVAVDHFAEKSKNSTIFFLSHGHSDHMTGLELSSVRERIKSDVILYCHPLTPMLMASFDHLGKDWVFKMNSDKRIVGLDIGKKHCLDVPGTNITLMVTLLPAGHCPGSVMFLFEWGDHRVLHTGDCRISAVDLKKFSQLHDQNELVLPISRLYLDTTFAFPKADDFPNRLDVIDEGLNIVDDWIRSERDNIVNFDFPAHFCHEAIFLRVAKLTRSKIHVSGAKYDLCESIKALEKCTTTEYNTRIHACKSGDCWALRNKDKIMTVRLTSTWWTKSNKELGYVTLRRNLLHICYSMHASLNELREMVNYLRPKIVTPLVLPRSATKDDIENSLRLDVAYPFIFESGEIDDSVSSSAQPLVVPSSSHSSLVVTSDEVKKSKLDEKQSEWNYERNGKIWDVETKIDLNESLSSGNLSDLSEFSDT